MSLMSGADCPDSRCCFQLLKFAGTSGSSALVAPVLLLAQPGSRAPAKRGADENASLNNCFFEKKDWRACKDEVRGGEKKTLYLPFLSANDLLYGTSLVTADFRGPDGGLQAVLEADGERSEDRVEGGFVEVCDERDWCSNTEGQMYHCTK